jgi:hypothetical protein
MYPIQFLASLCYVYNKREVLLLASPYEAKSAQPHPFSMKRISLLRLDISGVIISNLDFLVLSLHRHKTRVSFFSPL